MKRVLYMFPILLSLFACNEEVITKEIPRYYYRVKQVDYNGESEYHNIICTNCRTLTIDWTQQNITINSYTETNTLNITNNLSLNINDTLVVKGDFNLKDNLNINIGPKGLLIITGNLNVKNSGNISISNKMYVVGTIEGKNNLNFNNGNLYTCHSIVRKSGNTNSRVSNIVDLTFRNYHLSCDGLPITIKYFKVKRTDKGDSLYIKTIKEVNSDYVSIEHSINSLDFKEITRIKTIHPEGGEYTYFHKF